ncbi:hypothetical protein [Nonomuraea sp. NPDC005730]|uniref:hypothetical protein n=2 Tax=unclassified Nonomuraea TaxID=2593643 RepID=UPI0033DC7E0F
MTLNNQAYFSGEHLHSLLSLREAVASVSSERVKTLFSVALGSSVEGAGRLRRDGRALRFEAKRVPQDPWLLFRANVERMLEDLQAIPARQSSLDVTVARGDARKCDELTGGQQFEWIVFSPPYPNNIDYTEVYKTEAWALGLWDTPEEMKRQRLSTLRSHPSIKFPDVYHYKNSRHAGQVDLLLAPLLEAIPDDHYKFGREQVVRGYADDMFMVLEACRKVVKPHGRLVYVVGNSVHGSGDGRFVIAADLILARLAEFAGWRVEEIRIARMLKRRSYEAAHLRESVVVLRPA